MPERQVLAEAVSKRTKKSSEMKFTPFTCQNKVNYEWLLPVFGLIQGIIG
jgi:hypothetical protein